MTKEFGLLFFPSLPASIFNSINLIMPICDPKALFAVLLKQGPPWPCTGKSNMAEQFLNRSRICLRLLLCRGLMQVFCPGILYLLPSPLRQRRVKAVPWPSAHFLHRRHWPRVSSPCLGPTTAAAPLEKKKKRHGSKAVAVLSCSLRNAPLLTSLCSYPGTDILGPSPRLTFPLGLPRLVHSSQAAAISCWILHELGRYPGCGNGYLHSGKAPNHGLSLLTAVFQCLLSLCHDVASCFLTLSPSSSLCAPRGKCF